MLNPVSATFRRRTLASVVAAVLFTGLAPAVAARQSAPKIPLFVWKTATCGCCSLWVDHMRANGFDVKVQDVQNLNAIKRKLGVPPTLGSCHTAQAGRYVLEGHIPASVVHRLLQERPTTVLGLSVPGMPIGSPGMEVPGGQRHPYVVVTFDRSGQTTIYERR